MLAKRTDNRTFHLGRCMFRNERFTRLEPLLSNAGDGWVAVTDRRRTFPDAGSVFTLDRPAVGSSEGSLWLFRCEPNGRGGEDRFVAVDLHEPKEILDFGFADAETARRAVVERGLDLPHTPTREVVVVFAVDRAVRLELARSEIDGLWRPAADVALETLEVHRFDPARHRGARIGRRAFLLPAAEFEAPSGTIDWSLDLVFLPKVLRRIRRTIPLQSGGELATISLRTIERLVTALRDGEMLAGDPHSNEAMLARLRDATPVLSASLTAATELGDTLLQLPAVQTRLQEEIAALHARTVVDLRRELQPMVRAEIEVEEAAARAVLRDLEEQVAAAAARRDESRRELAELSREREEHRTGLAGDVEALLTTVARTADAFRQTTDVAVRFGIADAAAEAAAPWSVPAMETGEDLEATNLAAALTARERSAGFRQGALVELDAVARSGGIPVLFGEEAERFIEAYAACVSGGLARRMALDPATLGLDDLWRQSVGGGPTVLARAWSSAVRNPQRVELVVLDDLDAALECLWLPRLVARLSSPHRPSNLLVLATLMESGPERGPSLEVLRSAVPILAGAEAGAAAAAVASNPPAPTRLVFVAPPPVDPASLQRLAVDLVQSPGIDPATAVRAAALLRSALPTMGADAAFAFARDAAIQIRARTHADPGGSALERSFARLARRNSSPRT
ncbi:hypothetical protein [Methylobacterium sp. 13MFTsu3.1M2]|uniref:hypothetical protein n=1 Tax=Methylobacterium sp. 13MFTsu3.1M2 TaxID=1502776 RepID=UPI0008F2729D|nr:hypothetical protein [Methylobacterium sp. 13MFTsu3.1M2]SFE88529.1 hypothetical protein SAMN02799627_04617 [Methylobacterium sp. 13MFTsu3.1M2]